MPLKKYDNSNQDIIINQDNINIAESTTNVDKAYSQSAQNVINNAPKPHKSVIKPVVIAILVALVCVVSFYIIYNRFSSQSAEEVISTVTIKLDDLAKDIDAVKSVRPDSSGPKFQNCAQAESWDDRIYFVGQRTMITEDGAADKVLEAIDNRLKAAGVNQNFGSKNFAYKAYIDKSVRNVVILDGRTPCVNKMPKKSYVDGRQDYVSDSIEGTIIKLEYVLGKGLIWLPQTPTPLVKSCGDNKQQVSWKVNFEIANSDIEKALSSLVEHWRNYGIPKRTGNKVTVKQLDQMTMTAEINDNGLTLNSVTNCFDDKY